MEPVEIAAGRLHLRPWQPSDEEAIFAACQDPEIQRWTRVPSPYTREDAREYVTVRSPEGWRDGTSAHWAILDSTSAALLGNVLLFDIGQGSAEVGYWCAAEARGRGVMSDAVAAVCRWAFGALGLDRVEWSAAVGNWASLAVALKCGFRLEGTERLALLQRGERMDGWRAGLLKTDEVVDRRVKPPTLTDGVVTLRPWAISDAPDLTSACSDPVITAWLPIPQPYTPADAEEFLTQTVPRWEAARARVALAVTDAESGRLLGSVGLNTTEQELGRVAIGYWTAPWARGQGAASRATRLLSSWAFDELHVDRVELLADVDNTASQRVAEKAGFAREGVARAARRRADGTPRDFAQFSRVRS